MDPAQAIDAATKLQSRLEAGPWSFIAACCLLAAGLFLALFVWAMRGRIADAKTQGELLVTALTTLRTFSEKLQSAELQRTGRRRTTNPGTKPVAGGE